MKLRVLHVIYDDPLNPWVGGGGAVRLDQIYRRIAGDLDLTLVTGRFPGARDSDDSEDSGDGDGRGYRVRRVGAARPYALSRLTFGVAASRLLAREPYDAAVFDFSAYSPVRVPGDRPVGVMLGQMAGPTAVRRFGRTTGALVDRLERGRLRGYRHVAAVSPWLLEQARPLLHPCAESRVVAAGVDDRFFTVRRDERDFVLYYGRFDIFQKGIDVLVAAFARLASQRTSLGLKIAGRGRDAERIAALIRERNVPRVEIVADPSWPRLRGLLAGARVLAIPSRFEGFGMVAIEGMAAGTPIVAARTGALPDVIGSNGVLVPVDDAAALAAGIGALLDDAARRAALAAAAPAAARRWTWDAVAHEHYAWLHRIAGQEEPRVSRQPS